MMMRNCLIAVTLALVLVPAAGFAVAPVEDYSEQATDAQEAGISLSKPARHDAGPASLPDRLRVLEAKVDNLSQANVTARMEELQQTIQELRGALEKQSHDLEQLSANQKSFYQDINSRLAQAPQASAPAPTATASAVDPADAEAEAVKPAAANAPASSAIKASSAANIKSSATGAVSPVATNENVAAAKPLSGGATAKAATSPIAAGEKLASGEAGLYQQAFALLKSKQYDRALTQFKDYAGKYPQGTYAVNAHFWMGEINYLQGKHSAAKKSFETVVKNYPKDKKIPDALLKLAIIATDTGHKQQAEEMLVKIQKQYPGTTAARLAMIRSQELRLSTH